MLDDATVGAGQVGVGIIAQISRGVEILGRAELDSTGAVALLTGSAGRTVVKGMKPTTSMNAIKAALKVMLAEKPVAQPETRLT